MNPAQIESLFYTGLNATQAGDGLTAGNAYAQVLRAHPDQGASWFNYASLVISDPELAEVCLRRALETDFGRQHRGPVLYQLGEVLMAAGRFEDALETVGQLPDLYGEEGARYDALLGRVHYALGDFPRALRFQQSVCAVLPEDLDASDACTLTMLALGRFRDGLLQNKARWKHAAAHPFMHSPTPEWAGEDLRGRSLVVLHEQGFGDALQFMRYLPRLRRQFSPKRLVWSVRPEMVSLAKYSGLADEVCSIHDVPAVDFKTPLLTFPAYLDLSYEDRGSVNGQAYLRRPLTWDRTRGLRVGVVWGGKPGYADDQWRSAPARKLLSLLNTPGVTFVSLQQDERRQEVWRSGLTPFLEDLSTQLTDWMATARALAGLDLLVSVDSAVAHLAGAMGVPTLLMVPRRSCWRWREHNTRTTPWYDRHTILRQCRQGEWTDVVTEARVLVEAARDG